MADDREDAGREAADRALSWLWTKGRNYSNKHVDAAFAALFVTPDFDVDANSEGYDHIATPQRAEMVYVEWSTQTPKLECADEGGVTFEAKVVAGIKFTTSFDYPEDGSNVEPENALGFEVIQKTQKVEFRISVNIGWEWGVYGEPNLKAVRAHRPKLLARYGLIGPFIQYEQQRV